MKIRPKLRAESKDLELIFTTAEMNTWRRCVLLSCLLFSTQAIGQQSNSGAIARAAPPQKIIEAPNPRDIRAEPIFQTGDGSVPIAVAKLPQASMDEPSLFEGAQWHSTETISLAAKRKERVSVDLAAPSLLLARVNWKGTGAPIRLVILRGTVVLAEGTTIVLSPETGTTSLQTTLANAGKYVVSIENTGGTSAEVGIIIASMPQVARVHP